MEHDREFSAEQEQGNDGAPADPPRDPPADPTPRGRPWVKGQSGNPKGRPSRAYRAAYVAHALIDRKTMPLVNAPIDRALAGDRAAMRLCIERLAPPRRETPPWLEVVPAKVGTHLSAARAAELWIPAFAGMTRGEVAIADFIQ